MTQKVLIFFSYLVFLSRTFTINRTAAEVGGYSFKPSVPLPPTLQTLSSSPAITAESSYLHIARSWAPNGNLWFSSTSRQPLSYAPLILMKNRLKVKIKMLFLREPFRKCRFFRSNFQNALFEGTIFQKNFFEGTILNFFFERSILKKYLS